MSKAFKDTTALHTFDLLCQRRSKTPWLCTTLILTLCHVKGEVKYGHIVRLLFKRPIYLCFRIFYILTIKWKLALSLRYIFSIKKTFTWRGGGRRKQRENAAASGFPHFSGKSETRLKVSNLFPRAYLSFGQRQDTQLWNNPFQESKILGLPVSRRISALA